MQELKFFDVVISANRNYAEIKHSPYKHSVSVDDQEHFLLHQWFRNYDRRNGRVHNIKLSILNSLLYLLFERSDVEIYSHPDTLQERVDELLSIEADLFEYIAHLKQPRF